MFRRLLRPLMFATGAGAGVACYSLAANGAPPAPAATRPTSASDSLPEQRSLRKVCCYLGSSVGSKPEYAEATARLGRVMAERGIGLVYGGGSTGLMGVLARSVSDAGALVLGYIPELLAPHEIAGEAIGELHVVCSMHERKANLTKAADAFIALPGGFGTLDELFEALTWLMLGYHDKPIGIYNVGGYYDPMIAMMDHMVAEKFVQPKYRDCIVVSADPEELLDKLQSVVVPQPVVKATAGRLDAS